MNPIRRVFSIQSTSAAANFIKINEQVKQALFEKKGVVALESTIIAHGMPYPTNLSTGKELEEIIRSEGSIPATIAIMDGMIQIGLSDEQMERIAKSKDALKVSRRDIAKCLATNSVGATTVASTMWAAHQAGIRVFATGGIGGVHRYADQTFDISADLQELSTTPMTVVCAGVKSILDIPKTVEYLETHSVNTIVYSEKNVFPAFFTRESQSKGQFNTTNLEIVAKIIETSKNLGLPAGTLLACPIPLEHSGDGLLIEKAIQQALEEARSQNIIGQAATPFLLSRVKELTGGKSLEANVALVKNNARIAARLAKVLAEKHPSASNPDRPLFFAPPKIVESSKTKPRVVSLGAAICDFEAITQENVKEDGGSYVGIVTQRPGGVARNHADVLARLGLQATLLTPLGDDENGNYIKRTGKHIDLSRAETIPGAATATYFSMNVKGNVRYGISSIEKIIRKLSPEIVLKNRDVIKDSNFLIIDGNTPVETIKVAIQEAIKLDVPVWFEPTDIAKMRRLFETELIEKVGVSSPNLNEFRELCRLSGVQITEKDVSSRTAVQDFISKNPELLHNFKFLIVTLGEKGVVVCSRESDVLHILTEPSPLPNEEIVSVSGAGDCWNGGFLAGWLLGKSLEERIEIAQETTRKSLRSTLAVPENILPLKSF